MEVKGKVIEVLELQKGTSKAGKEWQKQTFVLQTDENYNNIYPIEIFGDKIKMPKENTIVKVDFNINANKWQDKYFVSLQAWKIEAEKQDNDLPF